MQKTAGLLYGPDVHHLDHLAVLCVLMQIPLIATEEKIAALASKYYPDLECHYCNYLPLPELIVQNYDTLFCCLPRDLFEEIFFFAQHLAGKKVRTIWCPHGNSDKGHASAFMEGLRKEETALVYGQKMIDFLIQKEAFQQLKAHVVIGNYRHQFYKLHKAFYEKILENEIHKNLPAAKKTILFAPTWQDREHSSSFFSAMPLLIQNLPDCYNLIIKPHPNLLVDLKAEALLWKAEEKPNILVIRDFPPIYPLLDAVDLYVGDMSSIGYDFLTFDKPMFFLNQNKRDPKSDPGLYLHRCGKSLNPEEYAKIYEFFEHEEPLSEVRQEVYTYTFAEKPWEQLRQEIQNVL